MPGGLRTHGSAPFSVAVVHGGPGAAGGMAPVARELARRRGVLEPLQAAASVDGQAVELCAILEGHAALPAALVGHSWGAWLSLIVAARWPGLVKKLILVGCGPLEERYAPAVMATRLGRLSPGAADEFRALVDTMGRSGAPPGGEALARLGQILAAADGFDTLPGDEAALDDGIYRAVWAEAAALRRRGGLVAAARRVRCPVVAIHGDYDPHPAEGVEGPMSENVRDFRFILLERCGHEPWRERFARDRFFRVLDEELP